MVGIGSLGHPRKIKLGFRVDVTAQMGNGFLAVIYISIELNNTRPIAIVMGLMLSTGTSETLAPARG